VFFGPESNFLAIEKIWFFFQKVFLGPLTLPKLEKNCFLLNCPDFYSKTNSV